MKQQMTVRDMGYEETYEWLDSDKKGPEPRPPEGMHELAVAEWRCGATDAHAEYTVSEERWEIVEDFAVCAVKTSLLYGLIWLGHYVGTWWSLCMAGSAGFIFLWKFWR